MSKYILETSKLFNPEMYSEYGEIKLISKVLSYNIYALESDLLINEIPLKDNVYRIEKEMIGKLCN